MTTRGVLGQLKTQVLVVGAGPVGLVAALRLKQQGIDVRIIDQQTEHHAHNFPVLMHPRTVHVLADLGLAEAISWRGRPVTRLAIYTEHERRAVLALPGLLTLPQDVLRKALTDALARTGVKVEWNTRLDVLQQDAHAVWGRLVAVQPASSPSPTAEAVWTAFDADYVLGADGYQSTVREATGIRLVPHGAVSSFAFFDAPTPRAGREAMLILSGDHAGAAYPLQDGMARFAFQLDRALHREADDGLLHEMLEARMPWFAADVGPCSWGGVAEFRQALAERFGQGRVWLAGEAAHLTGPLGVQSLNIGMDEANELALLVSGALRGASPAALSDTYDARRRQQWRELLGLEERAATSTRSPDWATRYLARLLPCLPASDADLDDLLDQLRMTPISTHPERASSQP